jgi:hypothetical protein
MAIGRCENKIWSGHVDKRIHPFLLFLFVVLELVSVVLEQGYSSGAIAVQADDGFQGPAGTL